MHPVPALHWCELPHDLLAAFQATASKGTALAGMPLGFKYAGEVVPKPRSNSASEIGVGLDRAM